MRRAIVLWVAHEPVVNWLCGLYTVLFELHDRSPKFQLGNIKQEMNSRQLMENENMKLEQASKLNIYKFKASDNHLNIHDCSDPADTYLHAY